MSGKVILVPQYLSSFEFYNNLLKQVRNILVHGDSGEIIFDFSNTSKIEPLTIPNLLCLGFWIKSKSISKPCIRIPYTFEADILKSYLDNIGFLDLSMRYDIFEFEQSPYSGIDSRKIDPLCGTLMFNSNDNIDSVIRGISYYIDPFSDKYLKKFDVSILSSIYDDNQLFKNEMSQFIFELVVNSQKHGESFSFTTLHAKHSTKSIYISVSDCGKGFLRSIGDEENVRVNSEMDAIFYGIYKRNSSKIYGLFNVIRRVLELSGKVRIHSNNTQIIFTERILYAFIKNKLIHDTNFHKFNVKNDVLFPGVHIELEIPMLW